MVFDVGLIPELFQTDETC